MKSLIWSLGLICILAGNVQAAPLCQEGQTYQTSKGASFVCVKSGDFAESWKDPSGMIWSADQGKFANNPIKPDQDDTVVDSPATEACAKIGGSLPTAQNYEDLAAYFDSNSNQFLTHQGLKDLNAIFPDMQNHWFWSSTLFPSYENGDSAFDSAKGAVGVNFFSRYTANSVRCVTH